MRDHPLRVLIGCRVLVGFAAQTRLQLMAAGVLIACCVWARSLALADAPELVVDIAPAGSLHSGAHATLDVSVHFASDNDSPLVLTPSCEGSALEVVRGRLMRSDAKTTSARELHFSVPVLAHDAGTAIVRVDVASYVCASRCRRVTASTTQVVQVAR